MTRREVLAMAGAAPVWFSAAYPLGRAQQQGKTRLGGAPAAFSLRAQSGGGATSFDIVEHCHQIGLGGVQTSVEVMELDGAIEFGKRVAGYGMQLILESSGTAGGDSVGYWKLDNTTKISKAAGPYCLHATIGAGRQGMPGFGEMPGQRSSGRRRYERFDSLEAFRTDFERTTINIEHMEPTLRRNQIKLAIETPDWRAAELAGWLKDLGSEWIGVCFDFGNNMALCDDPMDAVRTLAPYTFMCHIKDMAVDTYEDGLLLSEVALGEGILNLKEMVRILREKDPNMPFYLDMTTGDPLHIPALTDKYWVTFDGSPSPPTGRARIPSLVRDNPPKKPLPHITGLSPEAAVKLEDDNNLRCIEYARQVLGI
ncbi:MAG: TIM barrel protein [Bryobacteraceae bacterium]|jgi:sugar phosphate isomerase/epimerase